MALVLRKAVLPRNISLLKCLKGRPLATAPNKRSPAPLSMAGLKRSIKDRRPVRSVEPRKIVDSMKLPAFGCRPFVSVRSCLSCPSLRPALNICFHSQNACPPGTRSMSHAPFPRSWTVTCSELGHAPSMLKSQSMHKLGTRKYGCAAPSPKPCTPCSCGANSLPPPCNTPPKCIQYMTGYYYYPYGFWFCGPYHVSGVCVPVCPCNPPTCPPPVNPCPNPCGPCPSCICPAAAALTSGSVCAPKSNPNTPSWTQIASNKSGAQNEFTNQEYQPQQFQHCYSQFPMNPQQFSPPQAQYMPNYFMAAQANQSFMPQSHPVLPKSQTNQSDFGKIPEPVKEKAPNMGISKFFPFNSNKDPKTSPNKPSCRPKQASIIPISNFSTLVKSFPPVYCTPFVQPDTPKKPSWPSEKFSKTANLSRHYSDFIGKRDSRSSIHHRRIKKVLSQICPTLGSPKALQSQECRDRPFIEPGTFQYSLIPNFRCPYPQAYIIDPWKTFESTSPSQPVRDEHSETR